MNDCPHAKYTDGHCAEIACLGYFSKCPNHASYGLPKAECSIPREERTAEQQFALDCANPDFEPAGDSPYYPSAR